MRQQAATENRKQKSVFRRKRHRRQSLSARSLREITLRKRVEKKKIKGDYQNKARKGVLTVEDFGYERIICV